MLKSLAGWLLMESPRNVMSKVSTFHQRENVFSNREGGVPPDAENKCPRLKDGSLFFVKGLLYFEENCLEKKCLTTVAKGPHVGYDIRQKSSEIISTGRRPRPRHQTGM